MHAGVSQTLSKICSEFWIIQGRSSVKSVVNRCLICRWWEGGPFRTPTFAPLPECAISYKSPPFKFIGLDYTFMPPI